MGKVRQRDPENDRRQGAGENANADTLNRIWGRWSTRNIDAYNTLTVAPHVTLMGELPVVDALQSHPLNGHLRRDIKNKTTKIWTISFSFIWSIYTWIADNFTLCWFAQKQPFLLLQHSKAIGQSTAPSTIVLLCSILLKYCDWLDSEIINSECAF